jgi:Tfp pilus assembly protein PilZ
LLLPLRDRAAFRQQSFEAEQGGLFVPGDADVELGDEVELEIHFLAEEVRFRIRAEVRWKRAAGRRAAPPGIGLTFLASEDAARTQLLAFVDGDDVRHRERDTRRLPVHVEARAEIGGTVEVCQTDDISEGGCFLLVSKHPEIGARLVVKLKGTGALFPWVSLGAVVCWHRQGGDREGFGVRFVPDSEWQRRRLGKLVKVVRERVAREIRMHARTSPPGASTTSPTTSLPPSRTSMLPRK